MTIKFILLLITLLALGFLAAEMLLVGRRLQNSLQRVLPIFLCLFGISVIGGLHLGYSKPFVLAMFWAGYFLTWFGLRSHLESSILLKMLTEIHEKALTKEELITTYMSIYGPKKRINELQVGGLVTEKNRALFLTDAGKRVVRIAHLLSKK